MATSTYGKAALTGGASNALDAIDGSVLVDGDRALVITSSDIIYYYRLNATSGAAESSPDIISPDNNAGNKRWILQRNLGGTMWRTNTETLTGTKTLAVLDAQIQYLDPGGAGRDVVLPAEASSNGYMFWIVNTADATETLTVKDDGGATIGSVTQDKAKWFCCDGTTWKVDTSGGMADLIDDTSPQLGGDLDLNGFSIDFPTTPNISDCLDENEMTSDSATKIATQQSIKAYVDARWGYKSPIINGDFNIWQRGATFATAADQTYVADMWEYVKSGTMVHTITRDTDVPTQAESDHLSSYSIKLDCTTADSAIAASDYCALEHKIEGYNFAAFKGQKATLSFWVKATKIGTYCVSFRSSNSDTSYVAEYTVNVANTWEKKTITLTFDYGSGTWDYTNGTGLIIGWTIDCGTDYQGVADTWNTATDYATANQVNGSDDVANNFWLSQVQLEKGAWATEFGLRDIADEWARCQRYFCKSWAYGTAIGTSTGVGLVMFKATALASNAHEINIGTTFPVSMRANPTFTAYSETGTSGKVTVASGDVTPGLAALTEHGIGYVYASSTASTTRLLAFHFTADASL